MPLFSQGRVVIGLLLLVVVNVVWVLSAEYLFVDLNFKRPFFTTYVKSCLFSVFLLRYLIFGPQPVKVKNSEVDYSLVNNNQSDDDSFENESLTLAEFEPVILPSDYESDVDRASNTSGDTVAAHNIRAMKKKRRVRFSLWREVRRLPEKIAYEAKLARLPYRPAPIDCNCRLTPAFKYMAYFAPLWFVSSVAYQASLLFSSVSHVNMISASSSLFVLILGAVFSPHSVDRFTLLKFGLVILNLGGVAIISQFSSVWLGTALAAGSAFLYAIYLVAFSVYSRNHGFVDMNLLFGVIGLFSLVVCTPLMFVVHYTGLEPQLPMPTSREMGIVLLNGIVGSVLSDYLWLYATLMTHSLISSISLTMTIPMSMFADAFFRRKFPDAAQLLAAVPIMVSFIGAALISHADEDLPKPTRGPAPTLPVAKRVGEVRFRNVKSDESESLMEAEEELEL